MLRLIVDEKDRVVQSASVPVRWCISKEVLNVLKGRKAINPYVLIVTVVDGSEMTRQMVPMEDMMTYIQFAKPGQNTIFARIVWGADGKFNYLWETYLRRSERRYHTDVVNSEGEMFGEQGPLRPASVKVTIPEELFAKEPPEWEQNWVNVYFRESPRDQCDYRKRRLFAYTLQPIWFVLRFALGLFMAIFALLCSKWPNFKPLVDLRRDTNGIWDDAKRSIFVRWWYRDWHARKFLFLFPLTPIFWLCLFAVTWILSRFPPVTLTLTEIWFVVIVMTVLLMVIGGVADGIRFLGYYVGKKMRKAEAAGQRLAERKQEKLRQEELIYDIKFKPLLCDGRNIKSSIADLPPERRTIHLRFLDLKAKVCKPFAK